MKLRTLVPFSKHSDHCVSHAPTQFRRRTVAGRIVVSVVVEDPVVKVIKVVIVEAIIVVVAAAFVAVVVRGVVVVAAVVTRICSTMGLLTRMRCTSYASPSSENAWFRVDTSCGPEVSTAIIIAVTLFSGKSVIS